MLDQSPDRIRIHNLPVMHYQALQNIVAQQGELARISLRMPVNQVYCLRREELVYVITTGLCQPEFYGTLRLSRIKRIQHIFQGNSVPEIAYSAQSPEQLELAHKHKLKHLVLIGLIVEKYSQYLENVLGQDLRLVNEQDDGLPLGDSLAEQVSLYRLYKLGAGRFL